MGRSLSYYSLKVHSFLKQCLKDLHLTQFGGTFSWVQLENQLEVRSDCVKRRSYKKQFKNEWTFVIFRCMHVSKNI